LTVVLVRLLIWRITCPVSNNLSRLMVRINPENETFSEPYKGI